MRALQANRERLRLDASTGTVVISDGSGEIILLLPPDSTLWLGNSGHDGNIIVFPSAPSSFDFDIDQATAHIDGDLASFQIGTTSRPGYLSARGDNQRIELDGSIGRVRAT